MTKEQIENVFTYHAPVGNQSERYIKIREAAKEFAFVIDGACPESREKSLALTDLQKCVQWANASIAINEKPADDPTKPSMTKKQVVLGKDTETVKPYNENLEEVEIVSKFTEYRVVTIGLNDCVHELARVMPKLFQCKKCGLMINWRD